MIIGLREIYDFKGPMHGFIVKMENGRLNSKDIRIEMNEDSIIFPNFFQ